MKDISEYTNELYKRIDEKNEALGKRLSFKPWMKYAVAAAAFIVVVAGALVAINVSGAWRNDNLVHPNSGSENPGVIYSSGSDGGEPDGSSAPDSKNPSSEGTPAINGDSSQNGGNSGSENHGGQSSTPDKPDDTQTPPSEEPEVVIEGDFMKDNMPAVTYRIAGENKTFVYQKSSVVKTNEVGDGKPTYSVVDRYADPDGATLSVNADSGDLMRYEVSYISELTIDTDIPGEVAIETAKSIVLNTEISFTGFESASVSLSSSENGYSVTLTVAGGSVEVGLNNMGGLLYLTVTNNA